MKKHLYTKKIMAQYIGETNVDYTHGEYYAIMQVPMMGKIFKPGKDSHGDWLDTVGVKDERVMIWKDVYGPEAKPGMKVYTPEQLEKNWDFNGSI